MFAKEELSTELMMVDQPAGLTPLELAFCRIYAQGSRPFTAFMEAWKQFETEPISRESAAGYAGALIKKPQVTAYVRKLNTMLEEMAVMKMHQAQMYLTEAVLTPIKEITEDSPLCQKVTRTIRTTKDGTKTETVTYESVNKMDALKTLGQFKGWNAPIKVDHNHTGGVMMIPMAETLTDWEAAAKDSQKKLMEDAINV